MFKSLFLNKTQSPFLFKSLTKDQAQSLLVDLSSTIKCPTSPRKLTAYLDKVSRKLKKGLIKNHFKNEINLNGSVVKRSITSFNSEAYESLHLDENFLLYFTNHQRSYWVNDKDKVITLLDGEHVVSFFARDYSMFLAEIEDIDSYINSDSHF